MPPQPRILIAENDPLLVDLISSILQNRGYSVAGVVSRAEEALRISAELNPDLVIINVSLPGAMGGTDAAHYLFHLFHYPIIFISGSMDEEKLSRITSSQPYGVVFKPFTEIEISTAVNIALSSHRMWSKVMGDYPVGEPRKMMDSTTEAVILLDQRGRILFLNTFASWFIDIPPQKALMRHWRDVLMFINDQTNEEIKDPVSEVARQMTGATYDSHTAMVTTTSKRRKVSIVLRPVKDRHDRFLAILLSLRENVKKTYM